MEDFRKTVLEKIDANIPLNSDELLKLMMYAKEEMNVEGQLFQAVIPLLGRYLFVKYNRTTSRYCPISEVSQPIEVFPRSPDILLLIKKRQDFVSKDNKIFLPLKRERYFDARLVLINNEDFKDFLNSLNTGIFEERI